MNSLGLSTSIFLQSWNLTFLSMTHFFVPFAFYFHHFRLLNSYMFLLLVQKIISLFVHLIHVALVQLLFYVFLLVMVCFNILYNIFINIFCFSINNEAICTHITKFCIFTIFWFYIIMQNFTLYSFAQI